MILCFSGNGNSLAVARGLSGRLGDVITRLRGREWPVPADDGNRAIWVMPVYSWGLPPAVVKYIDSLPRDSFGSATAHHLVLTCGDDTGMAHEQWRRLMEEKGWRAVSTSSVQMPNTYPLLPGFDVDTPEVVASKLAAMPGRLHIVASTILSGRRKDDVVTGSMPRLKSGLVYPLFVHCDIHPRKFRVDTAKCISCGRCEQACPMANVKLTDGHPVWGDRCTMCLGCYNTCPTEAIDYGRRSRGKGRYYNR